jgi:hypothetical protein
VGDPKFNADMDLTRDGVINTLDLNIYKRFVLQAAGTIRARVVAKHPPRRGCAWYMREEQLHQAVGGSDIILTNSIFIHDVFRGVRKAMHVGILDIRINGK